MINYHGIKCPICEKEFTPSDDIVVCPECGTPHHRECYNKLNHCAKEELHGKEFFENPNNLSSSKTKLCPRCKTPNSIEHSVCQICGTKLDTKERQEHSKENHNGSTSIDTTISDFSGFYSEVKGESIGDLNRFIGVNSVYYISKMKLNPKNNNFMSWNWSAFFLTYIYFFYRKMYKAGIAFFLLIALSFIPAVLMADNLLGQALADPTLIQTFNFDYSQIESLLMISRFTSNIPLVVAFVSGLKANSMYCSHVLIKIHELRQKCTSNEAFNIALLKTGGVSMGMAIGIAAITLSIYFLAVQIIISRYM